MKKIMKKIMKEIMKKSISPEKPTEEAGIRGTM